MRSPGTTLLFVTALAFVSCATVIPTQSTTSECIDFDTVQKPVDRQVCRSLLNGTSRLAMEMAEPTAARMYSVLCRRTGSMKEVVTRLNTEGLSHPRQSELSKQFQLLCEDDVELGDAYANLVYFVSERPECEPLKAQLAELAERCDEKRRARYLK